MNDFNEIYESSNQKLKEMEESENSDELINTVLQDEEMIKNLTTNAEEGSE